MAVDGRGAYAAADRIAERRRAADDPDLERLPDNLLGLVAYVRRYQRVPGPILARDATDALVVLRHLQAELDLHKLGLMRLARSQGVQFADLARALGLRSRQSAENTMLRLQAMDIEDEPGTRREEEKVRLRRRRLRQRRAWATRGGDQLRAVVRRLDANRDQLPASVVDDLDDLLEELAPERAGEPVPDGFVAGVRLLLGDLRSAQLPRQVREAVSAGEDALNTIPS